MKIDRNLNLVLTVETESGDAFVHAVPINTMVFDRYFMTLSKAYIAMNELGALWVAKMGPRMSKRMIKRVAERDGAWDGPDGVERGFLQEIRRTTNVAVIGDKGWIEIPLQMAIDQGIFTPDDVEEVENAICFFTLVCACETKKSEANLINEQVFGLFGGQLTSSTFTEFRASSQTSTTEGNTGPKVHQSSIPR